jgi:DNA-directed RNA polymerase specialized sigma24 family protein
MASSDSPPGPRGDEAELFRAYNDELMRVVARSVHGLSQQTIEDAWAFAWTQFFSHQPDRDRNWQGWLVRTAEREAWALSRREQRQIGFKEFDRATANVPAHVGTPDTFQIQQDVEDAMALIGRLRPRLQRIALMRGLGFRYSDISAITGDSISRIGQLASLANQEIADMLATRRHSVTPTSPRAHRLSELESSPPEWLTERIGRLPRISRKVAGHSETRRAALALDDLRCAVGPDDFPAVMERPPRDADLRRYHDSATRALDLLAQTRARAMGRLIGD